ncbi:MAG TPA: hypothetical protein VLF91_00065 [Candidatus Saccharimonadales bacterium]|nr:hypothetical protein [Candidatus Saccharimonadales bacterium]
MTGIKLAESATEEHRQAYDDFVNLVAGDAELAAHTYRLFEAQDREAASDITRMYSDNETRALRIIGGLFQAGADQYCQLDLEVENACEAARSRWYHLNISSQAREDDEAAARTAWRRCRIGTFIASVWRQQREVPIAAPVVSLPEAMPVAALAA